MYGSSLNKSSTCPWVASRVAPEACRPFFTGVLLGSELRTWKMNAEGRPAGGRVHRWLAPIHATILPQATRSDAKAGMGTKGKKGNQSEPTMRLHSVQVPVLCPPAVDPPPLPGPLLQRLDMTPGFVFVESYMKREFY